jgi:DNA-binding NtrC family response regulator
MPARIVVVHDDPEFAGRLVSALRSTGHDVAAFADPIAAWDVVEEPRPIEVLVTGVQFPPGRSNGVALARKVRVRRPEIQVLLTAQGGLPEQTEGLGTFMQPPITVADVVNMVLCLLGSVSALQPPLAAHSS